ncbi:MAG: tetratricopeptide repeat protein [Chloroflexota bacterium]
MATLTLHLFGRPEMRLDGVPITGLRQKALAVVYYLATTRQRTSREVLAGLLWSDYTESRARGNLRVELGKLRPLLSDHLHIQRNSVAFDFNSDHKIDVNVFVANLNRPQPTTEQIDTAVSYYRGDFLSDFTLVEAPLFEEWQLVQQERLRSLALTSLQRLAAGYGQQKLYDGAITAVRRLLEIEPWSETGHQALMRWLALSGQRAAALEQYETCRTILIEELAVDPSPETDEVYEQILSGELDADPEAAPLTIVAPNLPTPFQAPPLSGHFVGRTVELQQLRQYLVQPTNDPSGGQPTRQRVGPARVALVGMGGIGKSTLANQISYALRDDFVDGVLWGDVATSNPLDILENWGRAYGYNFRGLSDINTRAAAVRGMLADKQVLVVLDDVAQATPIELLIPNGTRDGTLLTTRDLDIATVLNAESIQLGELSLTDGQELFRKVLGVARVEEELEATDEICSLLQHHPLALEITAMRLKARRRQKLGAMARRLREMRHRLGLEISDRAVRASFEVSWGSLNQGLRHLFAHLAVFERRPFTAAAAAYIIDADEFDTEDELFGLTTLSLLREEGEEHFRLHPMLADFAREKLGKGFRVANGRLATYYHDFIQDNLDDYDAFQAEWLNLLAGMRAAHNEKKWRLVIDYANALIDPWFRRTRYADIYTGLVWVQEAAAHIGDEETVAYMGMKWGQACIEQNLYEEAEKQLNKALAQFTKLEDVARIAEVQFNLARTAIEQNRYEEALALLHNSEKIRQGLNDRIGVAATQYRQARIWSYVGPDFDKAERLATEALHILQKEGETYWQINCLRYLAELELGKKNYIRGEQFCRTAYDLSEQTGNRGELAATLYLFTAVYRLQKQYDKAKAYAEQGLELFEQMGNLRFQGLILLELGNTLHEADELENALSVCQKSLKIFTSLDDKVCIFLTRLLWGDCLQLQEHPDEARNQWYFALELAEQLSSSLFLQKVSDRLNA